jgi:hypothetical protein
MDNFESDLRKVSRSLFDYYMERGAKHDIAPTGMPC